MRRCKGVLLAGMLVLSMSVPVYADKSVVVKVEAPADTTDYYMTVDSGGVGVDIYPSTDGKGEKLNDKTVRDGTVLQTFAFLKKASYRRKKAFFSFPRR